MPKLVLLALCLGFVLLPTYDSLASDDKPVKWIMGNEGRRVPSEEIPTLEEEGLKGSGEAAFRLYLHHDLVSGNYAEGKFWLLIAAENGHSIAQYSLGLFMYDEYFRKIAKGFESWNVERAKQRGIFWLKMSAEKGDQDAIKYLKKLGE